jgi:MarR-like DNA-binding transcriptional regulator SgrR of sgrS sRNA
MISAFMLVYITTCVIKQVELEFLKLYKFCTLLPPDVTINQEEKQVISVHTDTWTIWLPCALCSLECSVLANQHEILESLLSDIMWN